MSSRRSAGASSAPPSKGAASAGRDARPTPEERADLVVMRLERFIREHRTVSQGVSFRKWQDMARAEIADMLRDVEGRYARESRTLERALMVLGVGLATVGLWGTALAIDAAPDRVLAGILIMFGGLLVLWAVGVLGFRSPFRRFQAVQRRQTFDRVRSLNRKVADLEHALKKRQKALEKELREPPEG